MDIDVILKKAINKAVEDIVETAVEEWEGENGVGLKFLSRQIMKKETDSLKVLKELMDLLDKVKKDQIPEREIRMILGRLILLTICYCDCCCYEPNECAILALQYLS